MTRWMVLASVALGCSSAPMVRPDPVVVREPCLVEPPPAWEAVKVAGPEEGCPEVFEACFTLQEASRLDAQVRALRRWAREAWSVGGTPLAKEDVRGAW